MKVFQLVNLGGPINWVLFVMLCFCICQCIERLIYISITYKNQKKGYLRRIKDKAEEVSGLPANLKKKELEKEGGLIYYEMNRGLWFLNFISAVAPSIGLLGTVAGLISAFQKISQAGSQVNMQDLSGGIWVAMLTTAFGMIISIPAMFFYRMFRRICEKRMMAIGLFIENEIDSCEKDSRQQKQDS